MADDPSKNSAPHVKKKNEEKFVFKFPSQKAQDTCTKDLSDEKGSSNTAPTGNVVEEMCPSRPTKTKMPPKSDVKGSSKRGKSKEVPSEKSSHDDPKEMCPRKPHKSEAKGRSRKKETFTFKFKSNNEGAKIEPAKQTVVPQNILEKVKSDTQKKVMRKSEKDLQQNDVAVQKSAETKLSLSSEDVDISKSSGEEHGRVEDVELLRELPGFGDDDLFASNGQEQKCEYD